MTASIQSPEYRSLLSWLEGLARFRDLHALFLRLRHATPPSSPVNNALTQTLRKVMEEEAVERESADLIAHVEAAHREAHTARKLRRAAQLRVKLPQSIWFTPPSAPKPAAQRRN